jgi:hypothetical protein
MQTWHLVRRENVAIKSKAQLFMNAAPEPKKLIRVGRKILETRERIEMYVKRWPI